MIDSEKMKHSGELLASIHNQLKDFIVPGISTEDINIFCAKKLKELNMKSGALGYKGFPKEVCVSVNEKVCHGISSSDEILKAGDIVSVDIAASYDSHFADTCFTYVVQETSSINEKIVKAAYESMWNAIYQIKENVCISFLGQTMENTAKKYGFKTVEDFCGHGIGINMHEDPLVPFYYDPNYKFKLKAGMFITIEPMVVEKSNDLMLAKDNWTACTVDKGFSAQFEHTVMVLKNGFYVTTYNDFDLKNNKRKTIE